MDANNGYLISASVGLPFGHSTGFEANDITLYFDDVSITGQKFYEPVNPLFFLFSSHGEGTNKPTPQNQKTIKYTNEKPKML